MNLWIKNTRGEPSASLTFVSVAFLVIVAHMILSIFVNPFGLAIVPFNASEAMMVLSPLLATYWGRRKTDVDERTTTTSSKKSKTPVVNENE